MWAQYAIASQLLLRKHIWIWFAKCLNLIYFGSLLFHMGQVDCKQLVYGYMLESFYSFTWGGAVGTEQADQNQWDESVWKLNKLQTWDLLFSGISCSHESFTLFQADAERIKPHFKPGHNAWLIGWTINNLAAKRMILYNWKIHESSYISIDNWLLFKIFLAWNKQQTWSY